MPSLKDLRTRIGVSVFVGLAMACALTSSTQAQTCYSHGETVTVEGVVTHEWCLGRSASGAVQQGPCRDATSNQLVLRPTKPICIKYSFDQKEGTTAELDMIEIDYPGHNPPEPTSRETYQPSFLNKSVKVIGTMQQQSADAPWPWIGDHAIIVTSITPDTSNAQL